MAEGAIINDCDAQWVYYCQALPRSEAWGHSAMGTRGGNIFRLIAIHWDCGGPPRPDQRVNDSFVMGNLLIVAGVFGHGNGPAGDAAISCEDLALANYTANLLRS